MSPRTPCSKTKCRTTCSIVSFTLVELLIVFSVFLILISLLQPSLVHVFKTARILDCRRIQRLHYSTILLYAEDHDDKYPIGDPNSSDYDGFAFKSSFNRIGAADLYSVFMAPLKDYYQISGGGFDDNGTYFNSCKSLFANKNSSVVPDQLLCPEFLPWYQVNKDSTTGVQNLYLLRPSRSGSYRHGSIYDNCHPEASDLAGNKTLSGISRPNTYFFIHDTGFNRYKPHNLFWANHQNGWNVSFLDGSSMFSESVNYLENTPEWKYDYRRRMSDRLK